MFVSMASEGIQRKGREMFAGDFFLKESLGLIKVLGSSD